MFCNLFEVENKMLKVSENNLSFSSLVPHIEERLKLHHQLYSGQCKAELWEENCAYALRKAGFGSDWEPDYNHVVGVDQNTDCGIGISNKGGSLNANGMTMKISGSRLTKHKTISEKLEFLKNKPEDFIFCLATVKRDWERDKIKRYYFIVVDAKKLDYHNQDWYPTFKKNSNTTKTGYKCHAPLYDAKISKSMSDQIWTDISSNLFEEIHEIVIDNHVDL